LKAKLSRKRQYPSFQLLSFVLLFILLLVQFLFLSRDNSIEIRRRILGDTRLGEQPSLSQPQSKNILPFHTSPVCRADKMGLIDQAKAVAAEFEYSSEDVNKGVKAFIEQMGEGLGKSGATMSQIPTYVTAVPNGTEKVSQSRIGDGEAELTKE
jgi:hypothetical protein